MKNSKSGNFGGLVGVILVIAVVLIAWAIVSGTINELFASAINPLKKMIGFETEDDISKQEREKEVQKELEELEEEKKQKAIGFLDSIVDGYISCVSDKSYSDKTSSGIIGACNCGSKVNINNIKGYKIEFELAPAEENGRPIWKTILKLKDLNDNELSKKEINQKFKPCRRALAGSSRFPVTCPNREITASILELYADDGELSLAKGKDQVGQEEVFFGDNTLPLCQRK